MQRPDGHIDSYYAQSLASSSIYSALRSKTKTQICVIGGGLAGLTCALELAQKGLDVVLLEANRLGWAASGRNGGFVSAGFAEGMNQVARRVGEDKARQLHQLSRSGVEYVRSKIKELDRSDIIEGTGGLELIRHGRLDEVSQDVDAFNALYGTQHHFWDRNQLRQVVNSSAYQAAVFDEDTFHIHPLAYAQALAAEVDRCGVKIYEETAALALERTADRWLINTDKGSVVADDVVLATSAYNGVFKPLERAVLKIATYVVVSKPLGNSLDDVISFTGAMADTRRAGDYFRVLGKGDDRRLLWGGRITTRRSEPARLSEMLRGDIERIFPDLVGMEVEHAWSGLMGYARHKMPLIGGFWTDEHPNLWACTAFGGHGLNTTAMGGKLIADAIAHGDETYRLFEDYHPVWAGGLAGQAATQLAYWSMQWRDRREESKI